MKTKEMTKEQALEEIEYLKKIIDFNNKLNKFVRKYSKEHKMGYGEENHFNGYHDSPTEEMLTIMQQFVTEQDWMRLGDKKHYMRDTAQIFGQVYSCAVNRYILGDLHDCEKYVATFDNAIEKGNEENDIFSVERDTNSNRINLYFDGIPGEDIRKCLKHNGFRWSPKFTCWTRQLTQEAESSLRRIKKELGIE